MLSFHLVHLIYFEAVANMKVYFQHKGFRTFFSKNVTAIDILVNNKNQIHVCFIKHVSSI